jgi:hypothetical protein
VNEGVILSEVDREAINFVEGSAVAFRNFRFGGKNEAAGAAVAAVMAVE